MEDESTPSIKLVTMDRAASCTIFTRSDGKEARFPLDPSPFEDTSVIARLDFSPALAALLATTLSGDQVLFELPLAGAADQLAGRVVVYLDQNQWSLLSNASHGAPTSSEADRAAALRLREWVDQRRIVLPASAGHYYETGKRFSTDKRYDLGLTTCSTAGAGRCVIRYRSGETRFTMPFATDLIGPTTGVIPRSSLSTRMLFMPLPAVLALVLRCRLCSRTSLCSSPMR
ncbi:hypothetical protein [Streptomyces parvulus]|uniref:hypothetical protein n=1 Tax=Streptomyces parvulus TaxID=146923 RepID=UPI003D726B18